MFLRIQPGHGRTAQRVARIPRHMIYPGALQLFKELDRSAKTCPFDDICMYIICINLNSIYVYIYVYSIYIYVCIEYIYIHNIRQWLKEFNSGGPCSTFVEKR